jgi:Zn-dependent protease
VLTFPLGPFPVTLDLSFLLVAVLLGPMQGDLADLVSWLLVVFVSVLVHELGHATYALRLGSRPRIVLRGLGGFTMAPLPRALTWRESMLLALAGPAAGLLPGIASALLLYFTHPAIHALAGDPAMLARVLLMGAGGRTPFEELLFTFVRTGIFWTILNLLPVLPLDGGSVLQALLTAVRGKPSLRLTAQISVALSGVLAAAFFFRFLQGGLFLGLFLAGFALQNLALLKQLRQHGEAPQPQVDPAAAAAARDALAAARDRMAEGNELAALEIADGLEQRGGPLPAATAARIRAGVLLARGELGPAGLEAGRSFSLQPAPDAAVVAARAALRLGDRSTAQNWLRRAIEAGASLDLIRTDGELGPLVAAAATA